MPYLDDPVSLKLLAAGATFWVLLSIFIGNFEFLPHSLAYFPPPSSPNLGLNCSWGGAQPPVDPSLRSSFFAVKICLFK